VGWIGKQLRRMFLASGTRADNRLPAPEKPTKQPMTV